MKTFAIAAFAAAVAGSAAAQTTHCQPSIIGMPSAGVTCETSGGAPAAITAPSPPHCRGLFSGVLLDGISPADVKAECKLAKTRERVGELLAAGRCDEAVRAALETGNLSYAKQVRDFCATPTAP